MKQFLDQIEAKMHNPDLGLLIFRLVVAFMLLLHGIAKLSAASAAYFVSSVAEIGLPGFVGYGVYVGEIITPILLALGVWTRLNGIILVILCIFMIVMSHMGDIFALTQYGGWALEPVVFYIAAAVIFIFVGPGKYSVMPDSAVQK